MGLTNRLKIFDTSYSSAFLILNGLDLNISSTVSSKLLFDMSHISAAEFYAAIWLLALKMC